jgi:hypothetical protein
MVDVPSLRLLSGGFLDARRRWGIGDCARLAKREAARKIFAGR